MNKRYVVSRWRHTVWKFRDFSITQILSEINFGDFRCAKSAILMNLMAPNFDFLSIFALFNSQKLISHKIWMTEKFWNYHTVWERPLFGSNQKCSRTDDVAIIILSCWYFCLTFQLTHEWCWFFYDFPKL